MIYEIETLFLKPSCPAFCNGWGGERAREKLSSKEARMLLDTETRLIDVEPIGKGEPMTIPLENARQWKANPQQQSLSTSRTGPARPAKAPAATSASRAGSEA